MRFLNPCFRCFLYLILVGLSLSLSACGGSDDDSSLAPTSPSSTTGGVTFSGTVTTAAAATSRVQMRETDVAMPLAGVLVSAGNGSGTTDENGAYSFGADQSSFDPRSTSISLDATSANLPNPDTEVQTVTIPPLPGGLGGIEVNLMKGTDGTVSITQVSVSDANFSTDPAGSTSSTQTQCFCNDGLGPVGEDFTCEDTEQEPTECEDVTISSRDLACLNATLIVCGCGGVICQDLEGIDLEGGDSGDCISGGAAAEAAQCVIDNESDACRYFEDPVAEANEDNAYFANCL